MKNYHVAYCYYDTTQEKVLFGDIQFSSEGNLSYGLMESIRTEIYKLGCRQVIILSVLKMEV